MQKSVTFLSMPRTVGLIHRQQYLSISEMLQPVTQILSTCKLLKSPFGAGY